MSGFPKHSIRKDSDRNVYRLFCEDGEEVAAYAVSVMGGTGGVFEIRTGKGWTREMADMAFRAYFGGQK